MSVTNEEVKEINKYFNGNTNEWMWYKHLNHWKSVKDYYKHNPEKADNYNNCVIDMREINSARGCTMYERYVTKRLQENESRIKLDSIVYKDNPAKLEEMSAKRIRDKEFGEFALRSIAYRRKELKEWKETLKKEFARIEEQYGL